MLLGAMTWYHDKYFVKEPARNLELERHNFLNCLYRGIENGCIEQLRVSKKAFFKLCRILQEKGQLVKTRNVPIIEVVAMFLHILASNLKYRVVHFSYCRSMETISRQFKNVLRAIMKNSIGALDGIHIPVIVVGEDRPGYCNRKGDISTNVLGVCGPDLRFIYVLPGDEQQSDPILEAQDLELLSNDNELTNQQMERVTNNIGDEVTTIQATVEWIRFRDTLAMNMFTTYQIRINFD
ncbi:hypothetical protein D0Y65_015506 [Glycine soja]|uniref:DUF8040 domain-containing protein n=1 Tax=Glycine soja TaxID=3848 RepID=A0A445KDD5_GLYSO|nr:hypothetical protein D0Y65_015506 [Glycine soja]